VGEILERTIDEALRQVGVEAAAIFLLDEGVGELKLVTHRGLSEEFVQAFHRMELGEGLAGQVAEMGEPTILRDLTEYPEARRSYIASEEIRSAASVPLVGHSGVIGVMNLGAPNPEHFDAEGIELLVDLGRQIAIGVEKAQLYQEVRESEQRFQRLSRAASEGIMIHDQGRIVEANRTFAEMFGYKLSELVGMDGFKLIAPESRKLVGKHINAGYEESYEASMLRKDGTTFPAELIGKAVPYQGGTLRIVIIRDITERKEMQEQLMRRERLAVLGKLAGGVGHELRNPLGSIKNAAYFLNMALEERDLDPEVEETLGILEREVERSERIVSDLLDFARVKSPHHRKVNLNEITRGVLSRTEIPERVEVVEQFGEDLPSLMADPDQLEQVMNNLINNAIQAMPEGGRLTIGTKMEDPEWLSVSIEDTGMGIPKKDREKIFEPLYTTKAKGIGLGLSIVRTLVEGHGGAIEVESEVGQGSTFVVKLPIGVSNEEA
jgi:PAS domain S-box-containing protein